MAKSMKHIKQTTEENMNRLITASTITLFLLAACGGGESESSVPASTSAVNGVTDTEIVIGSHNDLSGPTALLGAAAVNGARMRFDEVNEMGGIHGRKIHFIVEDAQYQVPRAIQAANKLINRDKIFVMILAMGTPMNNAVMPMLFEKGIPNLFPISGARSMVEPFKKLQFTGRGIYYDEIQAGAKYFVEKKGASTPCIVYQDTDFGQEILDGARDQLAAMGMEAAAVSAHKPTDTEFTSTILRLRNAGCDLVLMGTIHKDTILIFETARKMGWEDVTWVGTNASYNQVVAELESGAAEGYTAFVHMAAYYRDDPELKPELAEWWDRYVEKFGIDPEYAAMEGYRNADLVVKALENAGPDLDHESLVAGMEAITDYTDIFGYRLSFGPQDHKGVKESARSTVKNRRWQTATESVNY
jgi:branched-chain amino acid transport system substrate-binding protein